MIITTKTIAKQYTLSEAKVRKILREANIPKVQEGYFWWIDGKYQKQVEKIFKNMLP